MIEIRDYQGRTHYVAPGAIAKISEASTSSQWHGIRCYVQCFDGSVIEAGDTADKIARGLNELLVATPITKQSYGLLSRIAVIAHCGGWADLSESEALTLIRRMTLPHFDKAIDMDKARAIVMKEQP